MSKAGIFEIRVTDPYPAWCEIFIEGQRVGSVSHKDLIDLRHAATKAMMEARSKLPVCYRHEVGE